MANDQLVREIRRIHAFSRRSHGRPWMHAELRDEGFLVTQKRGGRTMRLAGIVTVMRRRKWCTTKRDQEVRPAPDLVERNFTSERPNEPSAADVTYVHTASAFFCLAVVDV